MHTLMGTQTINGKLVVVVITCKLCALCERVEYTTYEDGRMVSRTYFDQSPVIHR
jgi:hypothetical protein